MCLILRNANEGDCDLLFEWVNDSEVRQMSFNSNTIAYDEHKNWFYNKLCSSLIHMFIICVDEKPVGQIRIVIENNEGIISFSIANDYRGQGYGSRALQHIINKVKEKELKIDKLVGKVKYGNMQSQKAFERAGYKSVDRQDHIEYYIDV